MYVHGNLALEERASQKVRDAGPGTGAAIGPAHRAKGMPGTEKLLWIGLALLTFAILGFYQYREAVKYELNAEMIRIENEIRALEEENALLRNEVAKLQSPERLIEKGILLGLVPRSEANGTKSAPKDGVSVASAR